MARPRRHHRRRFRRLSASAHRAIHAVVPGRCGPRSRSDRGRVTKGVWERDRPVHPCITRMHGVFQAEKPGVGGRLAPAKHQLCPRRLRASWSLSASDPSDVAAPPPPSRHTRATPPARAARHRFLAEANTAAARISLEHRHLHLAADWERLDQIRVTIETGLGGGIKPVRPGDRNTNTPNRSWRSTLPVTIVPGASASRDAVAPAARDDPSSTSARPIRFCAGSMLSTSKARGRADRNGLWSSRRADRSGGTSRRARALRCRAPVRRMRRSPPAA